MSIDNRRAKRHTDFIPVTVYVKEQSGSNLIAGPFAATIVDICNYGACLLLTNVTHKSFHIYHSTRKHRSAYLDVQIESHPHFEGTHIKAKPVWLNTFQREDFHERMIGIEFMDVQPLVELGVLEKSR